MSFIKIGSKVKLKNDEELYEVLSENVNSLEISIIPTKRIGPLKTVSIFDIYDIMDEPYLFEHHRKTKTKTKTKCECGAEHTSNINYHLKFCPIKE